MNDNRNNIEAIFTEIVEEFKKETQKMVEESINKIHGDLLPYVSYDTEWNAVLRAGCIVRQILSGHFILDGDAIKTTDGFCTTLTSYDYDNLVDKLAEKCSDVAAQKKIERLERQLKEYYENPY